MKEPSVYKSERFTYVFAFGREEISCIDKDKVIVDLAKNMPGMDVENYFKNLPNFFNELDHLQIVIENLSNEVVALFDTKWFELNGSDILYIYNAWIANRFIGGFLISEMLGFHFYNLLTRETKPIRIVFTKSLNPSAFKIFKSFKINKDVDLYPIISEDNSKHKLAKIVNDLAKKIAPNANLIIKTGILENGLSSCGTNFYSTIPKSSSKELNKFFAENLSPKDQILGIVDFKNRENVISCFKQFGKTHTKYL